MNKVKQRKACLRTNIKEQQLFNDVFDNQPIQVKVTNSTQLSRKQIEKLAENLDDCTVDKLWFINRSKIEVSGNTFESIVHASNKIMDTFKTVGVHTRVQYHKERLVVIIAETKHFLFQNE